MKRAAILFAVNSLEFIVVTVSLRMLAEDRLLATVLTDGLLASLGFLLIKRVSEAQTGLERAGYILGAMAGSGAGLLLARIL